jgi:hypothetical protein
MIDSDFLRTKYDIKEGAIRKTRELYKVGMPISELLIKIDKERFFTPNKKGAFKLIKEDLFELTEDRKDRLWRTECLALFLRECFGGVFLKTIEHIWYCIKMNDEEGIKFYNDLIRKLIEEQRSEWDK